MQFTNVKGEADDDNDIVTEASDVNTDANLLSSVLSMVKTTCEVHNVQPIIFFHPMVQVDSSGVAYTDTDIWIICIPIRQPVLQK